MRPARILLAFLLAAFAFPAFAAPDEELLGKAKGYPLGTRANWFFDEGVRVGSFSHLDELLPHYSLSKAQSPMPLPAAAGEARFDYRFENQTLTLDDFLAHQRVTGLLVIKDGAVLFERYQYDRKPADRFISHSMAKSIVSLGVGIALAEGKIASLDDLVSKYVPKLAGSAYGETTIRNVLRMSSGVQFSEAYDGNDDLTRFALPATVTARLPPCVNSRPAKPSRAHAFTTLQARPDSGRAAPGSNRHHAQRVFDCAALAADGRGGRRDLDQIG